MLKSKTVYPQNPAASIEEWQRETGASRIYNALNFSEEAPRFAENKCPYCGELNGGIFCGDSCRKEYDRDNR